MENRKFSLILTHKNAMKIFALESSQLISSASAVLKWVIYVRRSLSYSSCSRYNQSILVDLMMQRRDLTSEFESILDSIDKRYQHLRLSQSDASHLAVVAQMMVAAAGFLL